MNRRTIEDGTESFEITLLENEEATHIVLFAVGGGGNPERHLPLLEALFERGCTVVAPHFAQLASPYPTEDELLLRARRLKLALDILAPTTNTSVEVVGIGHSIGGAILLALGGGKMWMRTRQQLPIDSDPRLQRSILLAPATGFFQAPNALGDVRTPLLVWVGSEDKLTPPSNAHFLKENLEPRVPVEVRIAEGADHFSFMHQRPPHTKETLINREDFLERFVNEVVQAVISPPTR